MGHFDSHCHLDDPRFAADLPAVAAIAVAAGVTSALVPGVEPSSLTKPLPDVPGMTLYRAGGLHPAVPHAPEALSLLEAALSRGGLIAIGECGLDKRHRSPGDLEIFRTQLDLAAAYDLPVVLHVVHAHEEVLAALKARPVRGVVHAYGGSWPLAKRYLDLGIALGIGGIGTWPTATRLHETIRECPADGMVLETDAPDLSPSWIRGQRNEPAQLVGIAEAIATLRGTSATEVLEASDAVGARLFRIPVG
ncbi:putative deoxyribonuclease YjjV [compost metagenome]